MRAVALAAAAVALNLTPQQLAARQRSQSLREIATAQGVLVSDVRARALSASEPLLEAAVREGALSADERRTLRLRLRYADTL